jgi:flagellar motor switch protein FliN/FliY
MADGIQNNVFGSGAATVTDADPALRQHGLDPDQMRPAEPEEDLAAIAPEVRNIGVLLDIDMKLTVELGRARMKIRDIMNLSPGAVVELGKAPNEPVDIMVNGVLLARGEVVVVDEQFAVRITKLLSRSERIKRLT